MERHVTQLAEAVLPPEQLHAVNQPLEVVGANSTDKKVVSVWRLAYEMIVSKARVQ